MSTQLLNNNLSAQSLAVIGVLVLAGFLPKPALAVTAFTPSTQPTGYMTQEIVTNPTLTSGNESLFRADFEKNWWSGNLYDYPISATGAVALTQERWLGGVAPNLDAQANPGGAFSVTGRFIGTLKDTGAPVPFLATSAGLSATQQAWMTATVNGVTYNSTQVVNFLRGDHSNEGVSSLRQRFTPGGVNTPTSLGDIIHSKIVYVPDTTNPTVFFGANDGMLHAINTANGTERWAYVPSMLIQKMGSLAANPYTHDYYVDGGIAIGYNNVGFTATTPGNRTLVGALGAGGKGLYALNIDGSTGLAATSDTDAASKILWEITPTSLSNNATTTASTAYANLGYSYSAPLIKTINNNGTAQHVVLVGNGYNNGGDYQAYLFVINADNGALIRAIKADNTATNTSGTTVTQGTLASPNGLMNLVAFDANLDGNTDTVYAGDLNGAMWKFDLSSSTPSVWNASVLYATNPAQPITVTPAVLSHPTGTGVIVNFATGSVFSGTQSPTGTATGDLNDTSTFFVYGIWDDSKFGTPAALPAGNSTSFSPLFSPVITPRCYTASGTPSTPSAPPVTTPITSTLPLTCLTGETLVRRVSQVTPNWALNGGNIGWRIALPNPGERVVGEGSLISSGRYYFSTYNPTVYKQVPNTSTIEWGENWQMALDAASVYSTAAFMDLNLDSYISTADLIQYTTAEVGTIYGAAAGAPIAAPTPTPPTQSLPLSTNPDGIAVGKWLDIGVQSQPTLVKLSSLFTTLFDSNPDVYYPPPPPVGTGVTGGHFDVDIFFNPNGITGAGSATATITVTAGTTTAPATLGGINIGTTNILPALRVVDLPAGATSSTIATTIANMINANGNAGIYTASVSGSKVTVTAPPGTAYNKQTFTVLAGTTSSGTVGTAPSKGTMIITDVPGQGLTTSISCGSDLIISYLSNQSTTNNQQVTTLSTSATRIKELYNLINGNTFNGYTISCTGSTSPMTCTISEKYGPSACTNGFSMANITATTNTPLGSTTPGTAMQNWVDFSSSLTTTAFTKGADATITGDPCPTSTTTTKNGKTTTTVTGCNYVTHVHQYDKLYDVTGVDTLNPNEPKFSLSVPLPSTSQKFKVIMHNQYLNPAAEINIGRSDYVSYLDYGYTTVENFPVQNLSSSSTLDLNTLPIYTRNPAGDTAGAFPAQYIGSLVVNMPVDALTAKNWWGNGDVRAGILPTLPQCVWSSDTSNNSNNSLFDGNMYQPIIAPANGPLGYPPDGPGTLGWNSNTIPTTAKGVRHGGALTIQIIRYDTPNADIELNDDKGRPEYGWRVTSAQYSKDVLAEYSIYWHHPNGLCFGPQPSSKATNTPVKQATWTKAPAPDTALPLQVLGPTPGATDPKIGNLGGNGGGKITNVTITKTPTSSTTTITYADGSFDVVIRTVNTDGTVTTVTVHFPPNTYGNATPTVTSGSNGSVNVTVNGTTTTVTAGSSTTLTNGVTISNSTTANSAGTSTSGGLLNQNATGYRRISWKELIKN
jgi:Tfp pilus tip-associated adhesin PilY1